MIRIAIIASLLMASPLAPAAADGWWLTSPENATRRVKVTLSYRSKPVESWLFPVAKHAQAPEDYVQTKWVTFLGPRPKGIPRRLFTDTWLGNVDAEGALVRFQWWPSDRREGAKQLKNDFITVPFGTTETARMENGMQVDVTYESAS